jgi:hypothetical protein
MSVVIELWNRRAVASVERGILVVRHGVSIRVSFLGWCPVLDCEHRRSSQADPKHILADILQTAFDSKAGRNERPPRVGVNLIDVLAQVSPVQLFGLRS